jgi:uncharacterized protein (UPF0333 family)
MLGWEAMNKSIGLLILAAVVVVGGYFGYRQFAGTPAAPPAAPAAATGALPEAVASQIKTAVDAIPNATPEQKTQLTGCMTKVASDNAKPEEMMKIASDPAAMQAMMGKMATGMQDCVKAAGITAPAQ